MRRDVQPWGSNSSVLVLLAAERASERRLAVAVDAGGRGRSAASLPTFNTLFTSLLVDPLPTKSNLLLKDGGLASLCLYDQPEGPRKLKVVWKKSALTRIMNFKKVWRAQSGRKRLQASTGLQGQGAFWFDPESWQNSAGWYYCLLLFSLPFSRSKTPSCDNPSGHGSLWERVWLTEWKKTLTGLFLLRWLTLEFGHTLVLIEITLSSHFCTIWQSCFCCWACCTYFDCSWVPLVDLLSVSVWLVFVSSLASSWSWKKKLMEDEALRHWLCPSPLPLIRQPQMRH